MGSRKVPFSREIYIDHDDFKEDPPPKYFRLSPGKEVRLRYAYVIRCDEVIYENGNVTELRCTYDPKTRSGTKAEGRKVKGNVLLDEEGQISFDEINDAITKATGLKKPDFDLTVKSFNEYNSEPSKDGYNKPRGS